MSLSVVIPSCSGLNLISCVRAIQQRHDTPPRIIVVDDGASEQAGWLDVDWVSGVKPFVFSRNVNLGIRAAGDDDVIVLGDDGLLITSNGFTDLWRVGKEARDVGLLSAGILGVVCNPNQRPMKPSTLRYDNSILAFICILLKRATIQRVGLMDERFVGYGEDDRDYCVRTMRSGLQMAIWDGCIVDHTGHLTSAYRSRSDITTRYNHNRKLYQEKWSQEP